MEDRRISQKLLSIFVMIAMIVTAVVPTGVSVSAASADRVGKMLNTTIYGDIGEKGKDHRVTGFTEDKDGNLIVMGNTTSKVGTGDPEDGTKRVFLKKYAKSDLDNAENTAVIASGQKQIQVDGYTFGEESSEYYAGDSTYNGALTTDAAGNVYVAVVENASKEALYDYYWDLAGYGESDPVDGCICGDDIFSCDENGCSGGITDCPVCNAFREFQKEFEGSSTTGITVFKFDSDLNQQDSFKIAELPLTSTGTIHQPAVQGIAVDADGAIYVGGSTPKEFAFDNPQSGFDAYGEDVSRVGYIAKVNPSMDKVTASTYIASTASDTTTDTAINNMAIDDGTLYVTGKDASGMMPETDGSFQPAKNGENADVYLAKLNPADLSVSAATYYGGTGNEEVSGLQVTDQAVYIAGDTTSTNLPVSESAARPEKIGSDYYPDGFVLKLDKSLKKNDRFAASYYNGTGREDLFGLDVDANGMIYVTGGTTSGSGIDTTDGSDSGNIFIGKYNSDASQLLASSVVGEGSGDQGRGIIAGTDAIYLAGHYGSSSSSIQPFLSKYNQSFAHAKVKSVRAEKGGSSYSPKYYGKDAAINIKVTFDSNVTVTGTPTLELNLKNGDAARSAVYKEGSGTKTLLFEYTVKDGDTTDGKILDVSGENAIKTDGENTILPAAGGTADDIDLTVETKQLTSDYIYVKTMASKVKSVNSSLKNGTYGKNTVVPITVEFDDAIKSVTGTPELELNSGGKAVYTGISEADSTKLEFEYVAGEGDESEDLDYKNTNSLTLPEGAKIQDNYETDVDRSLPEPGTEGSLGVAKDIKINPAAVTVETVSVDDNYKNKAFKERDEIPIKVTFSQNVTTTGKMELELDASAEYTKIVATAEPVTDQNVVTFVYRVGKDDETETGEYLDYSSTGALSLKENAEITSGENPVSLYLPEPGRGQSLSECKIVIDNTAPVNSTTPSVLKNGSAVSAFGGAKYFKENDKMTVKVPLNETVTVKEGAAPYIEMNYQKPGSQENARWVYEHKEDSSGKTTLFFDYTVSAEDTLEKGTLNTSGDAWKIHMEPGDIADAAGNDLDPALKAPSWSNPFSNTWFDTEAPVWEEGAALKVERVEGTKNVLITSPSATDALSGLATSSPYKLYRQEEGSDEERVSVTSLSTPGTGYRDTSVEPNTTYIYTIEVADQAGNIASLQSEPLLTADVSGQVNDEDKPYWDEDKSLTVERTTESTAKATWDRTKAHDATTAIREFRVYMKEGFLSGWELIATVPADQESAEITGLSLDKDYTFKVEAVDTGINNLESEDGPQAELKQEFPYLIIQKPDGTPIRQFLDTEFSEEELTQSRFSSVNNYGTKYYDAVTGITVSDLLKKAGVENYTYVNLQSGDKASERTFTKEQIEGEGFYYYPGNYNGENAKQVKPMIGFMFGSSEGTDDASFDDVLGSDGVPRLFFGQQSIDDVTRPYFVKEVYYVTVNAAEESVSFTEKEEYTVNEDAPLPTVTAVKDGTAEVGVKIDGTKIDSKALSVNLVQMRGDKMVEIVSVQKENAGQLDVSGAFDLKEGDTVQVVLTKSLDGKKGSAAQILDGTAAAGSPKITLEDVYLKNGKQTAKITGKTKETEWVSVKVTDAKGAIKYFTGTVTDTEGNFSVNADLEGIDRPLDITVTCGTSVATASIVDFQEMKNTGNGKTDLQYGYGEKASALRCGITGMKVKYQWYSNTKKSSDGGKAIAKATGSSYVPPTSAPGIRYYYAVATDMDGNVMKTPIYTVRVAAKAPTAKVASTGYKTLKVTWSASPGASQYQVYRATKKTGTYKKVKSTRARSYTNKSLKFNRKYFYKVVAVSSGGNGTSKIVSAKPVPAKTRITKLTGKRKTYRTVKWKKVAGAKGYQVRYSTKKNFKKKAAKSMLTKKRSVKIKKLKKGKKYYVKVRAYRTYKGKKVYGPYSAVRVK